MAEVWKTVLGSRAYSPILCVSFSHHQFQATKEICWEFDMPSEQSNPAGLIIHHLALHSICVHPAAASSFRPLMVQPVWSLKRAFKIPVQWTSISPCIIRSRQRKAWEGACQLLPPHSCFFTAQYTHWISQPFGPRCWLHLPRETQTLTYKGRSGLVERTLDEALGDWLLNPTLPISSCGI